MAVAVAVVVVPEFIQINMKKNGETKKMWVFIGRLKRVNASVVMGRGLVISSNSDGVED